MKISADASFDIIYSIANHPQLGALIEGYVVQLSSGGNLSLVHQRVHGKNADYYDKKLDENDYKALALLDECSPEFIVKKFSRVKKIRPKEFFAKHFSQELYRKLIRPHIEKRLTEVMGLIYGKKVYIKQLRNVIFQEVEWVKEEATVLFHLRRNENNTHYFATVKHNDQRIHFSRNDSILLTEQPCYLISGGKILSFNTEVNGKKILPFLKKSFIEIPRKSEKTYFQKIIVPLLEKYSLYAVGFTIDTQKYVATPVVKLTNLIDGNAGIVLLFRYGGKLFPFETGKPISVHMEEEGDTYRFRRIRRSIHWENIKKDTLLTMDIEHIGTAQFGWSGSSDVQFVVLWATEHKDELRRAGFEILQDLDLTYALHSGELHYEWTADHDWFDVKAKIKFGDIEVPFPLLRKAIVEGQRVLTLSDGKTVVIPTKWIEQIQGFDEFSISEDTLRLKKQHLGLMADVQNQAIFKQQNKNFSAFNGIQPKALPKRFIGELRSYQKAGYDWLFFLRDFQFGGCLADDMGLGKTVQTLAMLQKIKEESIDGPKVKTVSLNQQTTLFNTSQASPTSLLVVPTSLIHNWLYETKKFCPDLLCCIHAGINRAKTSNGFNYYDVIITTYGTLRNDLNMFQTFHFDTIILDESQFIKNPVSKLAGAAYQLNGSFRLALTGTPIENTITDLWSQMNFANKGLLGSYRSFQKNYVTPIEKQYDESKTQRLHAVIKPFVMRRTKSQVATDLPPKTEQIVFCDMTEDQEDIYEKTKSTYRNLILDAVKSDNRAKSSIQILTGLTKLRQMANHPILNDKEYSGDSGKFQQVEQMLFTALEEGHKVLLFSQFVGHLQLYRRLLDGKKINYAYLDGSTTSKNRQSEVKKFQNNEVPLFLISLKAGGFGLNLTAADYVFLLDPWWNPAAEDQAIDRTHRIGQVRNVFSYRFVTNNTVEEKIIRLQEKKKNLSKSLIKSESSYLKTIDSDELQKLFL